MLPEAWREETSGLVYTRGDPLTAASAPGIVEWRRAVARITWQEQDHVELAGRPALDPGHIVADDLIDATALGGLLDARRGAGRSRAQIANIAAARNRTCC